MKLFRSLEHAASPSLFEQARAIRVREIESYKNDHALKAPVVLSARRDPQVRVEWARKF